MNLLKSQGFKKWGYNLIDIKKRLKVRNLANVMSSAARLRYYSQDKALFDKLLCELESEIGKYTTY